MNHSRGRTRRKWRLFLTGDHIRCRLGAVDSSRHRSLLQRSDGRDISHHFKEQRRRRAVHVMNIILDDDEFLLFRTKPLPRDGVEKSKDELVCFVHTRFSLESLH